MPPSLRPADDAVSPSTATFPPLDLCSLDDPAPADPSSLLSPTSPRTQTLLASFANLSPTSILTPEGETSSPSFPTPPFNLFAVLGNTKSFPSRQTRARAPSASIGTSQQQPHSSSSYRRRRSSTGSNPKFHSQTRSRRSSHTPFSTRSSSFKLSPLNKSFGPHPSASLPFSPPFDMASPSSPPARSLHPQRPCKSSLRQSPGSSTSHLESSPPSKRSTPGKAPPPEICIPNATPSSAAARLLDLSRSPSTSSVHSARSDWALSLGAFDTLPVGYQLQPSPPTSPGVSPTTANFPASSSTPYGRSRATSRLNSTSSLSLDRQLCSPPRTPLATARRRSYTSPMRAAVRSPPSASPQIAIKTSTEDKRRKMMTAKEKKQAKREKGRRKRAEEARPLPYSKKVEIDEFFGTAPAKKKTRQPASNDVGWRGDESSRHVGSGGRTEHVSEDGNVWLDMEEEQEWAWLLSETGKRGQTLPDWPQAFTSHLRLTSGPRGGLGPAADLEYSIQEIILETTYSPDDGDLSAWMGDAPQKFISVFNLKKDGNVRSSLSAGQSDSSDKNRPRPLQLFGSASSSASTVDRPVTPPLFADLDFHALREDGKSDFLSSTFHPGSSANSASPSVSRSPITPSDDLPLPVINTKARSNSMKSEKQADKTKASKSSSGGAIGKMKGFLKMVGN